MKVVMFLMCNNKNDSYVESSYIAPPFASSKYLIPLTANSCFFFSILSLSFSPSLPCWLLPFSFLCVCSHLQRLWSKIISIENLPSTNSMVQSTSSITPPSLVWSLHDVLHVACQSPGHPFIPVLLPFSLRPAFV